MNNFAIRYTKRKGVRLRYAKGKKERGGCMMSKIEGRRKGVERGLVGYQNVI